MRQDDDTVEGEGVEEAGAGQRGEAFFKHSPEFIILEDEQAWSAGQQTKDDLSSRGYSSLQQLHQAHYPVMLRVIAFFFSAALLLLTLAALGATLVCGVANVCTLKRVAALRQLSSRCYGMLRKVAVLAVGFAIAVFSPSFGLALIVIYFLIIGEKINQQLLQKIISGRTF